MRKTFSSGTNQLSVTDITRSRSSLLSFSRFSFSLAGPCRPERPRASLNSGSAKSMNWFTSTTTPAWPEIMPSWHILPSKTCKHCGTHACLNLRAVTKVSTNLMLHPHPKFVHLGEILEHKLNSISDCIGIPAKVKEYQRIKTNPLHICYLT